MVAFISALKSWAKIAGGGHPLILLWSMAHWLEPATCWLICKGGWEIALHLDRHVPVWESINVEGVENVYLGDNQGLCWGGMLTLAPYCCGFQTCSQLIQISWKAWWLVSDSPRMPCSVLFLLNVIAQTSLLGKQLWNVLSFLSEKHGAFFKNSFAGRLDLF